MRMPGFTAEASMYRSPTYLATGAAKPAWPDGVVLAWPYLCGVDCICDPGQWCTETFPGISCRCGPPQPQTAQRSPVLSDG
jgi:hypothetical protein